MVDRDTPLAPLMGGDEVFVQSDGRAWAPGAAVPMCTGCWNRLGVTRRRAGPTRALPRRTYVATVRMYRLIRARVAAR